MLLHHFADVGPHVFRQIRTFQRVEAHVVDHFALLVHHVVVLEQVLANVEVVLLDPLLGSLDGAGDHAVLDGLAFLHAQFGHDAGDAVGAKQTHQIVFEAEEEAGGAGVALAPRAAAQLAVNAPRLVPLGADDMQAARHHLVTCFLVIYGAVAVVVDQTALRAFHDAGAKLDVGATAGHVGRDGHGAGLAGTRDDVGFLRVEFCVEHFVLNAGALE